VATGLHPFRWLDLSRVTPLARAHGIFSPQMRRDEAEPLKIRAKSVRQLYALATKPAFGGTRFAPIPWHRKCISDAARNECQMIHYETTARAHERLEFECDEVDYRNHQAFQAR
jgi:hypothetical protein